MNNKILVLGDIHGRDCWRGIIENENPDKVIFLGDYVSTHDDVCEEKQINNFDDILKYKESNKDKVILLRGNHLIQHLGYYWADCSGYFQMVAEWCERNKDRILENTQWIYIIDKDVDVPIIFSHAGISEKWFSFLGINDVREINGIKPDERFGFTAGPDNPYDTFGDSIFQSCEWIRPTALINCNIKGYTQVVGHTPMRNIRNIRDIVHSISNDIWLCDCLPNEYLIIENGEFKPRKVLPKE